MTTATKEPTKKPPRAREGEEIWETTTAGTIYIQQTDAKGRVKRNRIGGREGTRLRISKTDREIHQDQCGPDNCFTNGLLIRVDARAEEEQEETGSPHQLSTEELMAGFARHGAAFTAFVDALAELNVRRMAAIADSVEATVAQVSYLNKVIVERFRVHGDTPTYREMKADGDLRRV